MDCIHLHHDNKPDRFSRIGTCPGIVFCSHCGYDQDHPQSPRIDSVVPQSSSLMRCRPAVMSRLGHIFHAGLDPLSCRHSSHGFCLKQIFFLIILIRKLLIILHFQNQYVNSYFIIKHGFYKVFLNKCYFKPLK